MRALLDAVVDLVALVSPAKISAIAATVRHAPGPSSVPAVEAQVGTPAARTLVGRVLAAWGRTSLSGDEVAGMLLGACLAHERAVQELNVELVWTGPTTGLVPMRRTEQVLLDLIGGAERDLFLVSFVAYAVPSVVAAMTEASARGVRLRVLVEASTSHGGSLNVDPAAMMRAHVSAAHIFRWNEKPEPFIDGRVHAKVAVVDGIRAFVTSANLTGYALEKNMEAGVLVTGGSMPRTLSAHLDALIDVGVIGRV